MRVCDLSYRNAFHGCLRGSKTGEIVDRDRIVKGRFVEAIPKNNYDKVLKTGLRRLLAGVEPG